MESLEKNEKMLGVMLDCSRNPVMKPEKVKNYAKIIKKMGYNTLMLYTEDTYEVDNQPYFGHLRGRYTKAELKDIDGYCQSIGIELIPCVQTLAHLETMFRWTSEYGDINDCDNILLVGEEKTYKLIEDMISTLSQCYSTKRIHIGMDEAYRVGTGKYRERFGEKDKFDIVNEHLKKVCEILKKYGFTEPIVWYDMFWKLAMNTKDRYDDTNKDKILERAMLPEEASVAVWDYYSLDYNHYSKLIETSKLFNRKLYFTGGAWSFCGIAPYNAYSMATLKPSISASRACGVDDILIAAWGDGGECSKFSILPALMYAAEAYKGNFDTDSIKAKFKEIVGADFDSFLIFDKLNGFEHSNVYREPVSLFFLYNDLFMGRTDYLVKDEYSEHYRNLSEEIKNAPSQGEYGYLFEMYAKLADVLSVKATIGNRTRDAYKKKDMAELKKIISDYEIMIEKLKEYHDLYEKCWFEENKPHAFEIQDIRIGGLIQRAKSCKKRLELFVSSELDKIEELEEESLASPIAIGSWEKFSTAGVF